MQATTYDRTARDRAIVRDVQITYAHGQQLTVVAQLSVSDLETWHRGGEITPDAYCLNCGEDVTECPEIGHLLVGWPPRTFATTWGQPLAADELGRDAL